MKLSHSILLAALSISSLIVPQKAQANLFRINIDQSGADVLFSYSGTIDLTGATFSDTNGNGLYDDSFAVRSKFKSASSSPFIESMGRDHIGVGDDFQGGGRNWVFSPTSIRLPVFGTNSSQISAQNGYTVTGSGDLFRLSAYNLVVPSTFSSGDVLSGEMRFADTTIAGLDITPGSYSYTLGNNTMEIVATPGPLPILGLPVIFLYYKRLKDKSKFIGWAKGAPIGASNSKL